MKYSLFFLFMTTLFSTKLSGQDMRSLSTKIADILNQIPARDAAHRNQLAVATVNLGPSGLDQLTGMVVPDGSSDDSRVRTALNGLVFYANQPGKYEERVLVANSLLRALKTTDHLLVKRFFLYHLAFIGEQEIIQPVAEYLTNPELVKDAVQALLAVRSPIAETAMRLAFPNAPATLKPDILQGIAEYALPTSAAFLRPLCLSPETNIRQQALRGLAKIGDPADEKTLVAAAKSTGYSYDPSEATRSLIIYLESLADNKHLAICRRIATQIITATSKATQPTAGIAALKVLSDQFGMDAFDQILTALDHERADYRAGVLNAAASIQDIAAVRKLIAKAEGAKPALKAQILLHLANQGHALAKPFAAGLVNAADPDVRAAALQALTKLSGNGSLPILLDAVRQTRSPEDKILLQQLLLQVAGSHDAPALLENLKTANPAGKSILLDILAQRHVHQAFAPARAYCADANTEIATAAYAALPNLAQPDHLQDLVNLLSRTQNPGYISNVQAAIIAIAVEDTDEQLSVIWQSNPALRPRLLGCFPPIGGKRLLALVEAAYTDPNLKSVALQALTQWKDADAADLLFQIALSDDKTAGQEAFKAFLRIVSASSMTPEQKVLQLRKGLDATAGQNTLQALALTHLSRVKTFPAFIAAAPYLKHPALASDAAWAIYRIALPTSDGSSGLYGETVRSVLELAITAISGPESTYAAENMRVWLQKMPAENGFVSIFNGKDLTGWQGLVGNPISRTTMKPEQLAKAQQEADARLPQNWSVRDGEIRFTGTGFENLCTVKGYGDFEMWVEWLITRDGDSGIYLRGTPQVQIWDTSLVKVGAQVGSGGLYNNQKNPSKPLMVADNPVGEWNIFYIRMIGDKVTVELNGQRVTDEVVLENYWDRNRPIFPVGPIELQAHGTNLAFRNIFVREITAANYQLSPEEIAEGYVPLFNGKDLNNWQGNKVDYKVVDQTITIDPASGGNGNLYTEKEYADFSFRFDFQLTPGANNGIGIRTPLEGDAAYVGMEIQVLDNTSPIYAKLQPYQYHGSVYGVIPAKREYLKPVGEWNTEEIRIQGNYIRVTLNGTVIVDGDLLEASKNGTIDKNPHPGLQRKSGYIGFLGHGSEVRFRNIRIKEL
jgi:hypothetical protein